jgi:hypothetical protein
VIEINLDEVLNSPWIGQMMDWNPVC